jgi:hypothetical protein
MQDEGAVQPVAVPIRRRTVLKASAATGGAVAIAPLLAATCPARSLCERSLAGMTLRPSTSPAARTWCSCFKRTCATPIVW